MKKVLDLHMHTNHSDGTLSRQQVIEEAKQKGLDIISITDHNSVKSYETAKKTDEEGITVLTGVEINTVVDGEIVELLCYGFDVEKAKELEYINRSGEDIERYIYNSEKARLKKLGYKLDMDIPYKKGVYGNVQIYNELKQHEENIKKSPELSEYDAVTFYRTLCCIKGNPFYIDFSIVYRDIDTIIRDFHELGAKVFLAHPFLYNDTEKILEKVINKVDGIECGHGECEEQNTKTLLELCKKNNKLISGGSDYHGKGSIAEQRKLGEYFHKDTICSEAIKWVEGLL